MESISSVFTWLGNNPSWAGLGVFLIAFSESLAVVGLILPGAVMMFGIGALVGTDVLPLWPTLTWAAAGAIAGDSISFWLGRRFHMKLKAVWPLRNHPELIASATNFFYRHGGKSILLGRFIGPIRPVIPAVAGMLEMPTQRFLAFNVISGILWAPVYVFPGILFATSLGLASEVASRLAVMIGSALGMVFIALWAMRIVFNRLHRYAYPLIQRSLAWARLHPLMGEIPTALLDPDHPEARGLSLLALLLLLMSTLFALLAHAMSHTGVMYHLDGYLLHTLESLRTPLMDGFFVAIAQLADWQVLLPLALVVFTWLLHRHYHHAAKHWLAAVALGALLSLNLQWLENIADSSLAAPLHSGQLMTAMAVYGFFAVLIAREFPEKRRWRVYAVAMALLFGISFARLYLGASRLSGILGALTLGTAWIALLGIAYRNHPAERLTRKGLVMVFMLTFTVAASWHGLHHHRQMVEHYAIRPDTTQIAGQTWWQQGWRQLPAYRNDMRGYKDHPLDLQFAGDLNTLTTQLKAQGWHSPRPVTFLSWLTWLNPDTPLKMMPVLPQVHNGQNETLLLVKEKADKKQLLALRLWPSRYRLQADGQTLWIGNVSLLQPVSKNGLTVPRTQSDFNTPQQQLLPDLRNWQYRQVQRKSELHGWNGKVLLLQPGRTKSFQ